MNKREHGSRNGEATRRVVDADRWHVEWSAGKVELFATNWKFVCGSRDSSVGKLYESIAETMNAAARSESAPAASRNGEGSFQDGIQRAHDLLMSASVNTDDDRRREILEDAAQDILEFAPTYKARLLEVNEAYQRGRDSARSERRPNFPMMDGPPIPMELAEAIWQGYAALFGKGQKLERVGERGGFGWGEVAAFWSKPKAREAITAALAANHDGAKP